jgi:hypothetical protein
LLALVMISSRAALRGPLDTRVGQPHMAQFEAGEDLPHLWMVVEGQNEAASKALQKPLRRARNIR